MIQVSMKNALVQLVLQSDFVSQATLLILFFMSIACWTVFFYKIFTLNVVNKQLQSSDSVLKDISSIESLASQGIIIKDSVVGRLMAFYLQAVKHIMQLRKSESINLTAGDMEYVKDYVDQNIETLIAQQESYLSLLSTCAAVAPLLGLFGTIWGLIHSFVAISAQKSADIAAVAPGIAEALITTLAGLIVAIPAMIMFHYLSSKIRLIEQELFTVLYEMESLLKRITEK